MRTSGFERIGFATRLRKARTSAGMSQRDLETGSGIPKSRISRYENGHLLPSLGGLEKLSESLGVSPSTLLGEPEDPPAAFARVLRERGVAFESVRQAQDFAHSVADELDRRGGIRSEKGA